MSSEAKKRKARNSFMYNGGEKADNKMKRINYYKKQDRAKWNKQQKHDLEQGGIVMNCDKCKYYIWYYDYCSKWKCNVDGRSVNNCFEPKD